MNNSENTLGNHNLVRACDRLHIFPRLAFLLPEKPYTTWLVSFSSCILSTEGQRIEKLARPTYQVMTELGFELRLSGSREGGPITIRQDCLSCKSLIA